MTEPNNQPPLTTLLRKTILEAIETERTTYKALERETGVTRASIMRFATGRRSLHLDLADKLAAHFGLELQAKRKGK